MTDVNLVNVRMFCYCTVPHFEAVFLLISPAIFYPSLRLRRWQNRRSVPIAGQRCKCKFSGFGKNQHGSVEVCLSHCFAVGWCSSCSSPLPVGGWGEGSEVMDMICSIPFFSTVFIAPLHLVVDDVL